MLARALERGTCRGIGIDPNADEIAHARRRLAPLGGAGHAARVPGAGRAARGREHGRGDLRGGLARLRPGAGGLPRCARRARALGAAGRRAPPRRGVLAPRSRTGVPRGRRADRRRAAAARGERGARRAGRPAHAPRRPEHRRGLGPLRTCVLGGRGGAPRRDPDGPGRLGARRARARLARRLPAVGPHDDGLRALRLPQPTLTVDGHPRSSLPDPRAPVRPAQPGTRPLRSALCGGRPPGTGIPPGSGATGSRAALESGLGAVLPRGIRRQRVVRRAVGRTRVGAAGSPRNRTGGECVGGAGASTGRSAPGGRRLSEGPDLRRSTRCARERRNVVGRRERVGSRPLPRSRERASARRAAAAASRRARWRWSSSSTSTARCCPTAATGTTSLPRNAQLLMKFSEEVDPGSVTNQTIQIRSGVGLIPLGLVLGERQPGALRPHRDRAGPAQPVRLRSRRSSTRSTSPRSRRPGEPTTRSASSRTATRTRTRPRSAPPSRRRPATCASCTPPQVLDVFFEPDARACSRATSRATAAWPSCSASRWTRPPSSSGPRRCRSTPPAHDRRALRPAARRSTSTTWSRARRVPGYFTHDPSATIFYFNPFFSFGDKKLVFYVQCLQGLKDLAGNQLVNPRFFGNYTCDGKGSRPASS